ncbi:MAG: B12-binding domain-containing radical SAM protein [Deltaproteobacteria bacterium]|nr:B12-binding domain-containing radical SAM protein [Deltaproteobacteria bacterium]
MKILLVNPRVPQTYFSIERVLKMIRKKAMSPPLGLLTVASLLPQEWDLKLVDLNVRDLTDHDWREADLVFVTGMAVQGSGILNVIRESKKRGKVVVAGGPLAFHFPEWLIEAGADLVVKGEAEVTMAGLLDHLGREDYGRVVTATELADMTASPPPRFDLLDQEAYTDRSIQFTRGCPFKCEFCDVTHMLGRRVRAKTTDQIISELDILYESGWRRNVFFVDDNFIGHVGKAKDLLQGLIGWMEERKYPFEFITQASVNLGADDVLLDLMVRAGFTHVFLGIETLDEESLKEAKKNQNRGVDLNEVCRKINRAGLHIIAGFIIGFDNESPGADRRFIDFADRNSIPEMVVTPLQAGPGTDLWKRLSQEGRVTEQALDDNMGSQTGLPNFMTTRPLEEIVQEYMRIFEILYDRERFLDRTFAHFAHMKKRPFRKGFALPYAYELRGLAIILFRQGVLYKTRWKFWNYLFKALTRFPARLPQFLGACIQSEHYFDYRQTIINQCLAKLRELRQS